MDINIPDTVVDGNDNPVVQPRDLKDYLVGPKTNILPVHGWTSSSILFNHINENVDKIMGKPMSSMVAIIIAHDRPADRAMGADAIADAIVDVGLAAAYEFTVVPVTPKEGDADAPILPHTNLVVCTSLKLKDKIAADPDKAIIHTRRKDESDGFTFYLLPAFPDHSWYIGTYVGLSDRLTRAEFLSALFEKLVADREVIKFIQEHHDRMPEAPDIPLAVRIMLEYAEVKACRVRTSTVWMPARRGPNSQRQNVVRLYMPPPSLEDEAIKAWKELLTSPSFTFLVDCRGRATPFKPARSRRARPMECTECLGLDHYKDECPIVTSPGYLAVHLNQSEAASTSVGTTLGTIRDTDGTDADGFKTVSRYPARPRFGPGAYKRPFTGRPRCWEQN
ncbi:hypothetical protein DFH07DRAFT_774500 [Mycena maculata]|uniref:Uncharacterized protein n=1 Tax=Mycena maculata TaxID=230809 RepID=A0AAD7J032_9AGAR|nr:hypothetical protein DFH07DRAFT_774500 [Mycena maculata]